MNKKIGKKGIPHKDPTIMIFKDDNTFEACISFKNVAVPITKDDIVSIFLTTFQVIKEHGLKLSVDEKEEIIDFMDR